MKKLLLCLAMLPFGAFSQEEMPVSRPHTKNEISLNAFELIIGGIVPITYERFLTNNQSFAVKAFLLDKHYSDLNQTNKNYNTFSLQAQYILYFSEKRKNAGFYATPFIKYTGGTKTETVTYYEPIDKTGTTGVTKTQEFKQDLNAIILGVGLGYKLVWREKFTFGLGFDLGRVLNRENYYRRYYGYTGNPTNYGYYGPVDFRAGMNMGFRF